MSTCTEDSFQDDDDDDASDYDYSSDEATDSYPNLIKSSSQQQLDMDFSSSCKSGIRMYESSELAPIMKSKIKEVTSVLKVPSSAAALLLREHKWVKTRVFDSYFGDQSEKIQEKCGVRSRCLFTGTPKTKKLGSRAHKQKRECQICIDDVDESEMFAMPCGHEFCRYCWGQNIDFMFEEGPSCVRATCPESNCREAVTEDEVAAVRPNLLAKFEAYQLRSFVEINGMTRWCPSPGCTRVAMEIVVSGEDFSRVAECDKCDTRFCLRCGVEPHSPVSCGELATWNEKCRNESETANWILANTKPCPKCSSRIEKNQGCNHMSCPQCKFEFCWICLVDWNRHGANTGGYYKCNRFDSSSSGDDQSDATRARRELDRYLHYYKRFHAHSEAQAFAKKQLRDTEARMTILQESTSDKSTWTDVEFLKAAVEQLIECRRVLKYTYTFAYYLTDTSEQMQKERFEYHQEMLERYTENLSELSERPLSEVHRTDVVNQTRVVNIFVKNILKYVEDGMEEN